MTRQNKNQSLKNMILWIITSANRLCKYIMRFKLSRSNQNVMGDMMKQVDKNFREKIGLATNEKEVR